MLYIQSRSTLQFKKNRKIASVVSRSYFSYSESREKAEVHSKRETTKDGQTRQRGEIQVVLSVVD